MPLIKIPRSKWRNVSWISCPFSLNDFSCYWTHRTYFEIALKMVNKFVFEGKSTIKRVIDGFKDEAIFLLFTPHTQSKWSSWFSVWVFYQVFLFIDGKVDIKWSKPILFSFIQLKMHFKFIRYFRKKMKPRSNYIICWICLRPLIL